MDEVDLPKAFLRFAIVRLLLLLLLSGAEGSDESFAVRTSSLASSSSFFFSSSSKRDEGSGAADIAQGEEGRGEAPIDEPAEGEQGKGANEDEETDSLSRNPSRLVLMRALRRELGMSTCRDRESGGRGRAREERGRGGTEGREDG